MSKKAKGVYPREHRVFAQAQATLKHSKLSLAKIELTQKELMLARLDSDSRRLNEAIDELFFAFEIRRGTARVQAGSQDSGVVSFSRALSGLPTKKWPLYWSEASSVALQKTCRSKKKKTADLCVEVAERLIQVFPKAALELKPLSSISIPRSGKIQGVGGDRLSSGYEETIRKDEKAFEPILEAFLEHRDSGLISKANEFIEEFPRSELRFRAKFLIAETHYREDRRERAKPFYESLIQETPWTFYAVVAGERLEKPLHERLQSSSLKINDSEFNLNPSEKASLSRVEALASRKLWSSAGFEFSELDRRRSYASDLLLYLANWASLCDQDLHAFRWVSELIDRGYSSIFHRELIPIIFPFRFMEVIQKHAKAVQLDPLLVISLIKQESGFEAEILSSSGAMGLMQLMPFTALDVKKDLSLASVVDPELNVELGTQYFAKTLKRFEGNVVFALAGYNAGPHRVMGWKKNIKANWGMVEFVESIPYRETRNYVMSILRNRYWYQQRMGQVPESVFSAWK